MSLTDVTFSSSAGSRRGVIDLPNECPWCYSKIKPDIIAKNRYDSVVNTDEFVASILLECPNCANHFHATYELNFINRNGSYIAEKLVKKPVPKSSFDYPEEVNEISSEFKSIISQTTHAESLGLNHLAGIGYRKSIEFLVKDYLIRLKGFDRDKTEKKSLGQCINDIEDPRIKALAKAATWIGNDETHYTRRHDKNIDDMKRFLHALTLLVSLEKSVIDAESFIEEK